MNNSVRKSACRALALVLLTLAGLAGAPAAWAQSSVDPVVLTVENASAKVGERAAVLATLATREGFRFTDVYGHRISRLSADGGVAFSDEVVRGKLEDGKVSFSIGVMPTVSGEHVINGLIRYSVHRDGVLEMKSARLIATVTGTP